MRRPTFVRRLLPFGLVAAVAIGASVPAGALSAVSGGGGTTPPIVTNPQPPIAVDPPPVTNGPLKSLTVTGWSVVATATVTYDGTPDEVDFDWDDGNVVTLNAHQIHNAGTPGTLTQKHAYKPGNGEQFTPDVFVTAYYRGVGYSLDQAPTITPYYVVTASPAFFRLVGACSKLNHPAQWTGYRSHVEGPSGNRYDVGALVSASFPAMSSHWHALPGSEYSGFFSKEQARDNDPMLFYWIQYEGKDEAGFQVQLDPSLGAQSISSSWPAYTSPDDCVIAYKLTVSVALLKPSTSTPKRGGIVVDPPVAKA